MNQARFNNGTPYFPTKRRRIWLALLTLSLALGLSSCDHEREYIDFPIEVQGRFESFTNERGWSVELESAHARLGPVRFYEGHPFFSSNQRRLPSLIKTAHAHPGHYDPTEAVGELLKTQVIDLLAKEPTVLGMARGLTGAYGSAEIELPFEPLDSDDSLGEGSFRLIGRATGCVPLSEEPENGSEPESEENGDADSSSGEESEQEPENGTEGSESCAANETPKEIPFDAAIALPRSVTGISFDEEISAGGKVLITVDLHRWLNKVDFSTLNLRPDQEAAVPETGSQAFNMLVRTASEAAAYTFTWAAGERQ